MIYVGTRHVAYWHVLPPLLSPVTCHPGLPSAGRLWSCQVRGAHPSHLVTFFPVLLSTSLSPQRDTQNQARGQGVVPGSHWLFPGAGCQPGVSGVCRCALPGSPPHLSAATSPTPSPLCISCLSRGQATVVSAWAFANLLCSQPLLSSKGFGKHVCQVPPPSVKGSLRPAGSSPRGSCVSQAASLPWPISLQEHGAHRLSKPGASVPFIPLLHPAQLSRRLSPAPSASGHSSAGSGVGTPGTPGCPDLPTSNLGRVTAAAGHPPGAWDQSS